MALQRIVNLARRVFLELENTRELTANINRLSALVNNITIEDIKFDKNILNENAPYDPDRHEAPIGYVYLWDSPIFSMGIFIVRSGEKIPLHNHPGMHGIIKILHGQAEISAFSTSEAELTIPETVKTAVHTWEIPNIKPMLQHDTTIVDKNSDPCILTPTSQNIHEIKALNGTTAFLDILAPPYDEERMCQYYKLLPLNLDSRNMQSNASGDNSAARYLVKTTQPKDFYCQHVKYLGPGLDDTIDSDDDDTWH